MATPDAATAAPHDQPGSTQHEHESTHAGTRGRDSRDLNHPVRSGDAVLQSQVRLDTGGAIKGEVRADLYLGEGTQAGGEAGRVRHTLRLYRLVPR